MNVTLLPSRRSESALKPTARVASRTRKDAVPSGRGPTHSLETSIVNQRPVRFTRRSPQAPYRGPVSFRQRSRRRFRQPSLPKIHRRMVGSTLILPNLWMVPGWLFRPCRTSRRPGASRSPLRGFSRRAARSFHRRGDRSSRHHRRLKSPSPGCWEALSLPSLGSDVNTSAARPEGRDGPSRIG